MRVTFTRTAARRYRVSVHRDQAPDLVMEPAPGFDACLPHDLVHFAVECHWRLRDGVFGQLAAGGTGLFQPSEEPHTRGWARKAAPRNRNTGADIGRSEALAGFAQIAWNVHKGRRAAPEHTARMRSAANVTDAELDTIMARLDELSEQWQAAGMGDGITLTWPYPERRHG
jgi:hypothetical protein